MAALEVQGARFKGQVAEAKGLANAVSFLAKAEPAVVIAIACCILIHKLDLDEQHLLPFARTLLADRKWLPKDFT